ncbi:serine protease inhibitor 77Ba-like [Leguminivora glycinivorella]|uniref:serine protease inhibitor 77Ba-like n=1 Tax=Leguminivora glycinivorella TaxID=1035111 RepID=UPI00200C10DE|nr:serine protease inhibitor 77Ba-like [Leguminivora glycinivorella]
MRRAVFLLSFCCYSLAKNCDERSVTAYYKKPIYEFSTGLLDRVSQETDGHFVCSPISTWVQLVNLAHGAHGATLKQIWKVTGHGKPCMQKILRKTLNSIYGEVNNYKSQSLVIVDKYLAVKKSFKKKVEKLKTVKVVSLDRDTPYESADQASEIIERATGVRNSVDPFEFKLTSLILADAATFKAAWRQPFDPGFTTAEPFYHGSAKVGEVNMMSSIGYFNYVNLTAINAEVIELPCVDDRRMLIFLPTNGTIKDLFFHMKRIRIATIFNLFKKSGNKLVVLKLPRFKISSELVNLPELISDMGVKYIFRASGNLKGISEFPIRVNRMKQVVDLEVTEEGVAGEIVQNLINPKVEPIKFEVNRPFAFMLVDRPTEMVLFAGVYSIPTMY